MKQAHVFISGKVQGVGYRYFVKSNARKLNLTGWVQNTEDGGVESVWQGEPDVIEKMVALCKEGTFLSKVEHIGFEWEEFDELYKAFEIRTT